MKKDISGTTRNIYLYILTSKEPVGVRELSRNLNLSSPSLAQYHINKLMDMNLLKQTRDTYDRLQEISPLLPPEVIKEFKQTFAKYTDISKPEETNGLEKIEVFVENPLRKSMERLETLGSPLPKSGQDLPPILAG